MKKQDINRLKKKILDEGIRFIDLKYCTLIGTLNHVTIPAERFEEITTDGVGVDGSSLPGYKGVQKGDMLLLPYLDTGFIDPFFEEKTISFLCSVYLPDSLIPYERDSRNIAIKAAEYLRKKLNTYAFFQAELEFYLFEKCIFSEGTGYAFYRIETGSESEDNITYPIRYKGGYHIGPPEDRYANLRNEMIKLLNQCGIRAKYHHHEVGSRNQMEIELLLEPLVRAADNIFLAKYLLKSLAQKHNKYLTFMPKPFMGEPGNGLHLHQYLGEKNNSLFYDPKKDNNLSELCLKYIGGILHHSRALCAFTNPSTNSYKRLIPGFEAPTYTDFALGSRTSAIRVPAYIRNKKELDIEYRIPDATSNPYLAISAVLLAGLDGIENNLKPDKREKLPTNSYEAINALREDHKFLLKGDVFNKDLIERWIEVKTKEFEEVHLRPHHYEFNLYLGV
ncbi:MAG: type I glutamate--ammonia ligase [candidate division WOR-3 bacterium]|nr:type I glutamate--ammonia ligase [candidate division WOR-3 bacterium]